MSIGDEIASRSCPGSCGARVACCDSLVGDVGIQSLVRRVTCIPSCHDDDDGCRFGVMCSSSKNRTAGIGSDVRGKLAEIRRNL